MALEQLIIRDWSAGLVTQPDAQDMPPNSCATLDNFHVTDKAGKLVGRARFGEILAGPSPSTQFTSFLGAYIYSVDRPSNKDVYLLAATDAGGAGAGPSVWAYPDYNGGAWTTNWSARQALNGTPDSFNVAIRRGEARIVAVQDSSSTFTGYWYGYIDDTWFQAGYTLADYFFKTTPLPRPLAADYTFAAHGNTSAAMPSDHFFDTGDYVAYDLSLTSLDSIEGLAADNGWLITNTGHFTVRIAVAITATAQDQRATNLNVWRTTSAAVTGLGTKRLLYDVDMDDGYLLDGLLSKRTRFANEGKRANTGHATNTWTLNQATWLYYKDGFTVTGALYTHRSVRCGNTATSGTTTNFYVEHPNAGAVATDVYAYATMSGATHTVASTPNGQTFTFAGDVTATLVDELTIIQDNTDYGLASRVTAFDFNITTPGVTTVTVENGSLATSFSGTVRFTTSKLQEGVVWSNRHCVVGEPIVDSVGTINADINKTGAKIKVAQVGIEETVDLFAAIRSDPTATSTEMYTWYQPTAGASYPASLASVTYALRVPWSYSGGVGSIAIWDHNQSISGNISMDSTTGMVGADGDTGDAYGRFPVYLQDRMILADVYQASERIKDAALYDVWQASGPAQDLFDPLNLIVFGGGDSGRIRGSVEFQNQLYVFKDYEVFVATIDYVNQDRVQAQRFPDGRGLLAEKSIVKTSGAVYYLSHDGFRRIDNGQSVNVSQAIKDSISAISLTYRQAAVGAWDNVYRNVAWLIRVSTTSYRLFVFEKESVWTSYLISVSTNDTLSLVQHPSGALAIVKATQSAIYFTQLGNSGTKRLNQPVYTVKTNHLLAGLNADSVVRQVYWRGINNAGQLGTLNLYTDGELSASFTVPVNSLVQDLVFQLQVDRVAGTYASHQGAYHELEFTTTSTATTPIVEVHHMGLSYTPSARPRMFRVA